MEVYSYVLSKYDQGLLLSSELSDEARVQGKLPDVPLVASVEKDGAVASFPVLIYVDTSSQEWASTFNRK